MVLVRVCAGNRAKSEAGKVFNRKFLLAVKEHWGKIGQDLRTCLGFRV